jgi:hypothetical protein
MLPVGGKVKVLYTRNIALDMLDGGYKSGLLDLSRTVRLKLGLARSEFYTFVDGPGLDGKKETNDTLKGTYDYLCTSAGYPIGPSEKRANTRVWVLNGWTKDEAIKATTDGMNTDDITKVEDAFFLCGGKIRDIKAAVIDYDEVKRHIDITLDALTNETVQLALQSSEISNIPSKETASRVRNMFRVEEPESEADEDLHMGALQIVDSSYILSQLTQRLELSEFMRAFKFAALLRDRSIQGCLFEKVVHRRFYENRKKHAVIQDVRWSTGPNGGVGMLTARDLYWVPSISNFPNIDSAVVFHRTLFAFQITIKSDHSFDWGSFKKGFVTPVREVVSFDSVVVFVIALRESDFQIAKFDQLFSEASKSMTIVTRLCSVDMSELDTLGMSMHTLDWREIPTMTGKRQATDDL